MPKVWFFLRMGSGSSSSSSSWTRDWACAGGLQGAPCSWWPPLRFSIAAVQFSMISSQSFLVSRSWFSCSVAWCRSSRMRSLFLRLSCEHLGSTSMLIPLSKMATSRPGALGAQGGSASLVRRQTMLEQASLRLGSYECSSSWWMWLMSLRCSLLCISLRRQWRQRRSRAGLVRTLASSSAAFLDLCHSNWKPSWLLVFSLRGASTSDRYSCTAGQFRYSNSFSSSQLAIGVRSSSFRLISNSFARMGVSKRLMGVSKWLRAVSGSGGVGLAVRSGRVDLKDLLRMSSVCLSVSSLSTVQMERTSLWLRESRQFLSLGLSLPALMETSGGILSSSQGACAGVAVGWSRGKRDFCSLGERQAMRFVKLQQVISCQMRSYSFSSSSRIFMRLYRSPPYSNSTAPGRSLTCSSYFFSSSLFLDSALRSITLQKPDSGISYSPLLRKAKMGECAGGWMSHSGRASMGQMWLSLQLTKSSSLCSISRTANTPNSVTSFRFAVQSSQGRNRSRYLGRQEAPTRISLNTTLASHPGGGWLIMCPNAQGLWKVASTFSLERSVLSPRPATLGLTLRSASSRILPVGKWMCCGSRWYSFRSFSEMDLKSLKLAKILPGTRPSSQPTGTVALPSGRMRYAPLPPAACSTWLSRMMAWKPRSCLSSARCMPHCDWQTDRYFLRSQMGNLSGSTRAVEAWLRASESMVLPRLQRCRLENSVNSPSRWRLLAYLSCSAIVISSTSSRTCSILPEGSLRRAARKALRQSESSQDLASAFFSSHLEIIPTSLQKYLRISPLQSRDNSRDEGWRIGNG